MPALALLPACSKNGTDMAQLAEAAEQERAAERERAAAASAAQAEAAKRAASAAADADNFGGCCQCSCYDQTPTAR